MYKRDIYLDIDDNLNNYIKSVELDSNSRVWHFHLTVDYEPLDLTGKSVQFRAEKPDKTNVLNDCKIVDAEKGVVEVKLTRQVNAIPGHVKCLLKIIGDEGFVLKTKTFVVDVSKTLSDDAIVSSDEFGALEAALGKVQDIDNRFAQTNAQLSELANKGTTVEVLERVTKEEIKRQIADGTIANLTIEKGSVSVDKLNNEILELTANILEVNWRIGTVDNATGNDENTNQTRIRTSFIDLKKGTVILKKSNNKLGIYFFNKDNSFVSSIGFSQNISHYTLTEDSRVKIVTAYSDDRTITDIDIEDLANLISICEPISNELLNLRNNWRITIDNITYKIGTLDSNGMESNNKSRIVSDYIEAHVDYEIINNSFDKMAIYFYNLDGTYKSRIGFADEVKKVKIEEDCLFRIVLAYSDDRVIDNSNIDDLSQSISIIKPLKAQINSLSEDFYNRINSLDNDLNEYIEAEWELGTLGSGYESDSDTRIRTDYLNLGIGTIIKNNTSNQMAIHFFTKDKVFTSSIGFSQGIKEFTTDDNYLVRIVLAYSNNKVIDDSNIDDLSQSISIIKPLKAQINSLSEKLNVDLNIENWELGTLGSGYESDSDTRIRTDYLNLGIGTVIKNNTSNQMAIHFFTKNKNFTSSIGFSQGIKEFTINEDCLVRIVLAYSSNKVITDSEIEDLSKSITIESDLKIQCTALNERVYELEKNNNDSTVTSTVISDSGREFVYDFEVSDGGSYLSDHTFVGDELWLFPVSSDDHSDQVTVSRYTIDIENKSATLVGSFKHNFSHCNTVDYSEFNDCLIMGNGGNSTNKEPNEIYIFENASSFRNRSSVDVNEAIRINVADLDWGKQVNVLWGDSNGGKYNIAYAISNDSVTRFFRKLLLGQGTNNLGNGQFLEGRSSNQFNGTFKVLKTYSEPYSVDVCNQGTDWHNGVIYEGYGHNCVWYAEKILCENGNINVKQIKEKLYNEDGSEYDFTVEGIAIYNNHIFIGSIENKILVYKLY